MNVASHGLFFRKEGYKTNFQVLSFEVKKFRRYVKKYPRNTTVQIYQVMKVDETDREKKVSKGVY